MARYNKAAKVCKAAPATDCAVATVIRAAHVYDQWLLLATFKSHKSVSSILRRCEVPCEGMHEPSTKSLSISSQKAQRPRLCAACSACSGPSMALSMLRESPKGYHGFRVLGYRYSPKALQPGGPRQDVDFSDGKVFWCALLGNLQGLRVGVEGFVSSLAGPAGRCLNSTENGLMLDVPICVPSCPISAGPPAGKQLAVVQNTRPENTIKRTDGSLGSRFRAFGVEGFRDPYPNGSSLERPLFATTTFHDEPLL